MMEVGKKVLGHITTLRYTFEVQ